jgi:hypothetical protein
MTARRMVRAGLGHGSDGDSGGGGRGGDGLVPDAALKAKKERDGNSGEGGGAVWQRR